MPSSLDLVLDGYTGTETEGGWLSTLATARVQVILSGSVTSKINVIPQFMRDTHYTVPMLRASS